MHALQEVAAEFPERATKAAKAAKEYSTLLGVVAVALKQSHCVRRHAVLLFHAQLQDRSHKKRHREPPAPASRED